MVDIDRSTTTQAGLPSPRFDEHAHLRAQPVTPIPKGRMTLLFERVGQAFAGGAKSLALMVVLGVVTGALIGVSLAGHQTPRPPAQDQASVLRHEEAQPQIEDAEVGVYGIQASREGGRRTGNRRARVQSDGRPRAYRFAVIR